MNKHIFKFQVKINGRVESFNVVAKTGDEYWNASGRRVEARIARMTEEIASIRLVRSDLHRAATLSPR